MSRLVGVAWEQVRPYLEVEDAGVLVAEALTVRNHAMQQAIVERQRADGSQQPAVTCRPTTDRVTLHLLSASRCVT